MAAARVFLFGARDVWFVVGLPVFLYAAGWRYMEVGRIHRRAGPSATAGMQAFAPRLVIRRSADGLSRARCRMPRYGAAVLAACRWCWPSC